MQPIARAWRHVGYRGRRDGPPAGFGFDRNAALVDPNHGGVDQGRIVAAVRIDKNPGAGLQVEVHILHRS